MTGSILALNAGSSSLKFAVFGSGAGSAATARGEITGANDAPRLRARDGRGAVLIDKRCEIRGKLPFEAALDALLAFTVDHLGADGLAAIGHRVVHGGPDHVAPEPVTPKLMEALDALIPLAPLHMPHSLAPIRAIAAARPGLPQVACFDTAFHHTLPPLAWRLALPRALEQAGLRRYGFHGLSYEFIAGILASQGGGVPPRRAIVAHLGAGASLCALENGVSIATTMGFSALDGLVMATRCGSLDPGVILYLAQNGHSIRDIEDMLYHRSGLLGVSGISADVQVLLASKDPQAHDALDLFAYRIACEAAGLVSALGGLDALVFTAGIGEHAPTIRESVCARLHWLGVRLDADANATGKGLISGPGSSIAVHVIGTDEESVIAQHTRSLMKPGGPGAWGDPGGACAAPSEA